MRRLTLGLILAATTVLPLTAQASRDIDNQKCIEVYRDGYLDLRDSVQDYNGGKLSRGEFAAEVTAIGTTIKGLRAACFFTESPDVSKCVDDYKEIYSGLRDRIRVRAVLSGNQDKINISENNNSRSQGGFLGRLRNQGADTVNQGKLVLVDAKCL